MQVPKKMICNNCATNRLSNIFTINLISEKNNYIKGAKLVVITEKVNHVLLY